MKMKYFIDSHKGVTALFVLILMAVYDQWQNPTAWVYLALHGTYGLLWVLKSRVFPDQAWEAPTSWFYGIVAIWGGLSLYWVAPWLLMRNGVQAPAWYLGLAIAIYAIGVFLHFSSDMQKHTALKLAPGRLIQDGLFSRVRNPNYFGELLIYSGFGSLAMHWLPGVILAAWVVFYWLPRMRQKDRILAQYPEFAAYRQRTRLFIPFLF